MKTLNDETIHILPERLPSEIMGMSIAALHRKTGIHRDTIIRIRTGQSCRESSYVELLKHFGYSIGDFTSNPANLPPSAPILVNDEWEAIERPSPVNTAQNGLQYRVYKLRHRHLGSHFGRGKRYDIAHLGIEERGDWIPKLERHAQTCLRIRHPRIPHHLGFFRTDQSSSVWWVVDAWTPGRLLSEIISEEDPIEYIPSLAAQIAEGLMALHSAGIIRRDLSPDSILVGDGQVTLTEFELAKLGQGAPTVSKNRPTNPFVAPEVSDGEAKPQADLFSWARVITHLLIGKLVPLSLVNSTLGNVQLPEEVRRVLVSSCEILPSKRPASFVEIWPTIQKWAKGR